MYTSDFFTIYRTPPEVIILVAESEIAVGRQVTAIKAIF